MKIYISRFLIVCISISLSVTSVHAAITDIQIDGGSTDSIDENTSSGTTVGTLTTTGGNSPYTYEFINGTGDEDNSKFSIVGDALKLNFTPDYENPTDLGNTVGNNTYATKVKVTDTGETAITTDGDDYSSAYNNHGGYNNADNYPNRRSFTALAADGSISAWGDVSYGGSGAPVGTGYTKIYSNEYALAALAADGSIHAWGYATGGGTGEPSGMGYTKIYSTGYAFAALAADGSISAWGNATYGGTGAPSGTGYTKIYSTPRAFAVLASDGSISAWGNATYGGSGAPSGIGYTKIYSNGGAFAALKSDGSISVWGDSGYGGSGAPSGTGYTKIYSTHYAFAAVAADGSISAWGSSTQGGSGAPSGIGYVKIYSSSSAFAALASDGSISAWGSSSSGAPSGTGYTKIYSTGGAFAALAADGSIHAWGVTNYGGIGAPSGTGYTKIYSTEYAFAALAADGSISAWGDTSFGGTGEPSGTGYTKIYSNEYAFAALASDGSISAWGSAAAGGSGAPSGTGYSISYGEGIETTLPGEEYEKQLIISINDISEDVVILNPDSIDMNDVVNNGYVIVDNGTIDSTTGTTTQVQVTFQSNTANAVFPTNTVITEQTNQNFDFSSFVTQNTLTSEQTNHPNAVGAVRLGVPGISLNFSNPITVEITVSEAYNDMELDVLSQLEGEVTWNTHSTCTVTNGICTFTTDHATTYIVNGDGTISGLDDLNLNVEVNATLSMDCYDKDGVTGDYDVILGTVANPGIVIAGTPAVGESTCIVTTNDTQGYYLSMVNDNGISNTTLVHSNNTDEIPDLTQFSEATKTTESWNAPTTKGLGFSVIQFPQADTTHNTFNNIWTTSGNLCEEGTSSDDADYAGVPQTAQVVAAHTAYNSTSTTTDVCYKVDVSPSQPSGVYTGSVTYTATSDASGFWQ